MILETKAYGKINWSLKALGRFPADHPNAGFTQIQSVVFKIDLHDNVRVTVNDQGLAKTQIKVSDPRIPQDGAEPQKNSAYRAVELFSNEFPAASRACSSNRKPGRAATTRSRADARRRRRSPR